MRRFESSFLKVFSTWNILGDDDHKRPVSQVDEFLKQSFRFARIRSIQEPLPLKHVFDLTSCEIA